MPVIMVTSEDNETKLGSIKSNGVTAMLDKPFEAPHLKELLEGEKAYPYFRLVNLSPKLIHYAGIILD